MRDVAPGFEETADRDALHVQLADRAVCIGPPAARDSYLNVSNVIGAAETTELGRITNLSQIGDNRFTVVAVPLAIKGGDASPVRVVALVE